MAVACLPQAMILNWFGKYYLFQQYFCGLIFFCNFLA